MEARYCDQCGDPAHDDGPDNLDDSDDSCRSRAALEPPRFCPRCRRRMVVQVLPRGWSARCSEHGLLPASSRAPGDPR